MGNLMGAYDIGKTPCFVYNAESLMPDTYIHSAKKKNATKPIIFWGGKATIGRAILSVIHAANDTVTARRLIAETSATT
jgi:hypothetical protein